MEAARGILVVLATAFIAAECFLPIYKRDDIPAEPSDYYQPSCLNAIQVCIAPIQQNPLVHAVYQNPSALIDHADEFCGLFHEAADCIRPTVDECDDNARPQLEATLSFGDFVCSSRGRSLLRDIQQTACYTESQATLVAIRLSTFSCIRESSPETVNTGNICQHIPDIQRCGVQVATQHCGEAAGEFVSEFLQRLVFASQPQCSIDTPQEVLKRSFGLLSKKRGLLF